MRPSLLHRFLGFAGNYALLSDHERRLQKQEQAMSKSTFILVGLATSLATLTNTQKQEADDVQKISTGMAELLASKSGDDDGSVTMTSDELTQLQSFGDSLKAIADSSSARASDLDALVAKLPTDAETTETTDGVPTTTTDAPSTSADPTVAPSDPGLDVPPAA